MIHWMAFETAFWVIVSGSATVAVAGAIGAPAAVFVAGSGFGRLAEIMAVGSARVLAPTLLGLGSVAALTNTSIQITITAATIVVVQLALALVVMTGLGVRAVRLLPSAVFEQLDALRLGRATSLRLVLFEVWPKLVASSATALALGTVAIGSVLMAGGRLGWHPIGADGVADAGGARPGLATGLLLAGFSVAVLVSIGSLRRSR